MILRKLLRNRGLGLNLVAGACFIILLVNGWGLSWRELGSYALALLILLVALIGLGALCGWLLHKISGRRGVPLSENPDHSENDSNDNDSNDNDTNRKTND